MTVAESEDREEGEVIDKVFVSSIVDLIDPTDTPALSVAPPWVNVLLVPEEVKVGITPVTRLPLMSFKVIVTVAEAVPSAFIGPDETARVDRDAAGAPATNVAER